MLQLFGCMVWQLSIFLALAFPPPFIILFFLRRNAYIGKNILVYGTNQKLDKNPLISQGLTPSCSNSRITNISWFHLALPSPGLAILLHEGSFFISRV